MAPTLPPALTRELGTALADPAATPPGGTDAFESTPELQWPLNLAVFDKMRRTDSQMRAVGRAAKNPIQGTGWAIPRPLVTTVAEDLARDRVTGLGNTAGDVDPRVRAHVEAELGLAVDAQGRRRARRGGVSWDDTLRHLLLMLDFGHMPLEQVYQPGPPDTPVPQPTVNHLHKLAPRMPRTLAGVDVAADGGLAGIRQYVVRDKKTVEVPIPVDRLVMFTLDREGGNWLGESIYRSAYKHWLIKDVLIRVAASAVDRTGMGLPVVFYPAGEANEASNRSRALKMARELRVGDDAGVGLPTGWEIKLLGVEGSVVDALPWVKYHDQAASRSALQMVLDLGHDRGAQSLGETFVDLLLLAGGAIITQIEDTLTEHVIRDLVRINFSEDEPYPPIVADPLDAKSAPTAEALAALAAAGLIDAADPPVQDAVHRRYGLPAPSRGSLLPGTGTPDVPAGTPQPERDVGPAAGVVAPTSTPLRSQPTGATSPGVGPPLAVAAAAGGDPPEAVAETEAIRRNRATPQARASHRFRPAKWTHPNGHPRCLLCGDEERTGGVCAGADHDGLATSAPGSRGVTTAMSALANVGDDPDELLDRVERVLVTIAALRDA